MGDIKKKCELHPHKGGWLAKVIDDPDIIDNEEPDFKEKEIFQHEESLHLMERLQYQYTHSANRRAYVPGDMPNEIWRILFNDQWLVKGYTPKWGIGYSAEEEGREQSPSLPPAQDRSTGPLKPLFVDVMFLCFYVIPSFLPSLPGAGAVTRIY